MNEPLLDWSDMDTVRVYRDWLLDTGQYDDALRLEYLMTREPRESRWYSGTTFSWRKEDQTVRPSKHLLPVEAVEAMTPECQPEDIPWKEHRDFYSPENAYRSAYAALRQIGFVPEQS